MQRKSSLKRARGPIAETLFERLVTLIPLRYSVSCLFLTMMLGIPGTLLMRFLDSFDLIQAFSIAGTVIGSESYLRAVVFYWFVAYILFIFYLFYFIRNFRLQLVKARTQLSPLLSGGEEAYDKDFRIVSSRIGAITTSAIIGACFAPSVMKMITNSLGYFSAVHVVLSQAALYLAGGTGIWLFFSSIWSLRKFAKESMKVKSSSEDSLFGLGSIGSISLGLVLVYFGAVGLRGVGILMSGVENTPMVVNLTFELVLLIFGLIAFLSTIYAFHRKMVDQKELERCKLFEERRLCMNAIAADESSASRNSRVAHKLLVLDYLERRLERIRTWPFDTAVLSRLSTILLSVIAIMIARVIVLVTNL